MVIEGGNVPGHWATMEAKELMWALFFSRVKVISDHNIVFFFPALPLLHEHLSHQACLSVLLVLRNHFTGFNNIAWTYILSFQEKNSMKCKTDATCWHLKTKLQFWSIHQSYTGYPMLLSGMRSTLF